MPIRTYTMSDGLPRDKVFHIMQDSKGCIWMCVVEGLSRFDGYAFKNCGEEDGLPNRGIFQMEETQAGDCWVVTGDGLYHFDPLAVRRWPPSRPFTQFQSRPGAPEPDADSILPSRSGNFWCIADGGLASLRQKNGLWRMEPVPMTGETVPPLRAQHQARRPLLAH